MCKKNDGAEAGLIRVRHVGRTVSGGPPMTAKNVAIALHALRRESAARRRAERSLEIPAEALAAVGVAAADELEVIVGDGELVLRPKRS